MAKIVDTGKQLATSLSTAVRGMEFKTFDQPVRVTKFPVMWSFQTRSMSSTPPVSPPTNLVPQDQVPLITTLVSELLLYQ